MAKLKKIILYLKYFMFSRYGYAAVILLFLVHMTFIDEHNWLKKRQLRQNNKDLMEKNKQSEKDIKEKDNEIRSFSSDKQYLEKYARENFLMKEPNEDIFLFDF
jgi:cell division protein FtsB